jgi:hypothetical protein
MNCRRVKYFHFGKFKGKNGVLGVIDIQEEGENIIFEGEGWGGGG